jgi:hypothetical protein
MCEEPPVRVRFKMRPHIIFAPVVFRKARCENCPVKARIRFVQSKHRPYGGTQEQQSADKLRYRIPGTLKTGNSPSRPNISGLPGRIAIFQKSTASPRVCSEA